MHGFIRKKKEKKLGSNLGKGRRLPIPNIPGDEWENQSNQGKKNINRMQRKPYDINFDEGFTTVKAQEITTKTKRERDAHKHSHTIVHAYIHTNAVLW